MIYSGNYFPSLSHENAAHFAFEAAETPTAPAFQVRDAHLLFSGDYQRIGSDLIISDQSSRVVVPDYFKGHGHSRPVLVSADGAPLSSDFVDALTGYTAYAQAAPQNVAGKVVGHIVNMTGSASIVRNGVTIVANVGDAIYQSDVVQTGSNSTIGLVLDDGSTFNLSANARFLLNDLTYDPNSTSNSAFLTLVQGAASFVAGQVAKTGDMRITTPVASIGIRGTAVNLDISSSDGKVSISVIDQRDGTVHAVEVFNNAGVLIGTVTSNGASLTLTPTATFEVIAQQVNKTPDQVAQEFSAFQQVLSTYDAAKQIFPNLPQHTDNSDHQDKDNNASPNSTTKFAGSPPLNPPGTEYHAPTGTSAVQTASVQPTTVVITTTASTELPAGNQQTSITEAVVVPVNVVNVVSLPFVVTSPNVVPITSGSGDHTGPVMSAKGDVVYDPDGAIYFYDRASNTTSTIALPGNGWSYTSPTISSDGRYIFYQGSNGSSSYVFVYGTDPSDSTHYHVQTLIALGAAPAASGDGSTIVAEQASGKIGIFDLEGNSKGSITAAAVVASGAVWSPAVSADGHIVAFWSSDATAAGGSGHLYAYNISTATFLHLADTTVGAGTVAPTISADGHLVAYQTTDASGHSEIYLYNLSKGSVVFQTDNSSGSHNPVLSPDGHFIVFTSDAQLTADDTNAVPDVYVVDVTSPSNPVYKLVSEVGGVSATGGVAISAGGQYIAYGSNSNIFFADPTSGHSAVIVETANSPGVLATDGFIKITGDYTGVQIEVRDQFGSPTPNFSASFDSSGRIHWTFSEDKGDFAALSYGQDATQQFVVTLSASSGTLTIPVFVTVHNGTQPTISVADFAPVASPIGLPEGQQGVTYTITSAMLVSGVVDVDGPSLSVASLSLKTGDGALSQLDSGTWAFTPAAGFSGHVAFDYQVTDTIKSASSIANLNIALPLAIAAIDPDSGTAGDFITKSTSLTVAGSNGALADGERIQISSDNGVTWAGTAQTTPTSWSYSDPATHDISFTYQVRVLDSASAVIASAKQAVTIDTMPPVVSITAADGSTNQPTFALAGALDIADAGALVTVLNDGELAGTATAGSDGKWSTTLSLRDGTNSLTAQAVDVAGNLGTSNAIFVTLDTTAPTEALAITAINQDTGTAGDFLTSDTTLTVSGSNGALGSGEKIQVSSDGGASWADVTQSTATSWSYLDPATHAGSFTYQTRIIDTAGNIGTTASQAVTIDTTAPTITISNVGGPTNQANQTIAGTVDVADAGATVTVYDGSTAIKTAIVQGDGSWSALVTLGSGSNSLTAKVSDLAGNTTTSNAVVYTLSTTGPAVTEHLTSDTGASALDQITSNAALSGTGLANTTVQFTIDGTLVASTSADGSGNWSFTPSGLGDGLHTIVASQTDTFNNTGSASLTVTLDTTAPTASVISTVTDDVSPVTGSVAENGFSNDPTLTVAGTAEPGSTVNLYDTDGATVLGTGIAIGGSYSITTASLSQGSHTLTAKATDVAGNTSVASSAFHVTVDTLAPADIILSNTSVAENSATGTVVGSLAEVDPGGTGTATFSLLDNAGGLFAISNGNLLVAGILDYETAQSHQVTVRVTDAAGNIFDKDLTVAVLDVAGITVTGDAGANVLIGTSEADSIFGLGGNDRLQGLGGNDTLDGGAGFDRAVYSDATGSVTVNLAAGTASGAGVGSDTLISIEGAVGGDFADTFDATGFAGSSGQPGVALGQSAFEGRGGDDVITGCINDLGQSLTRVEYLSASAAVTVDLAARTGQGTVAGDVANVGHDTFTNALQGVYGSAYGDTIYGSNNANFTYEVFEGRGGDDYIDGRGGYDIVTYNNDVTTTSGITVHLAAGTVTGDSTVGTDTLRDVEAVRGTNFDDVFDATGYGLVGALNVSSTNGTFNDFAGAGGNDTIIGNGNTRLNYSIAQAAVTVDLQITAGTAITVAGSATGATEGTDTFTGVNAVQASVFADTLLGSSYNNTFTGLGGDDYIDGRGGFDTASYNNLNTVTGGVAVNMAAGTVTGDASTGTDTLRNIEAVQGTGYADTYDATGYGLAGALNVSSSNGSFNQFEGLGGDDSVAGNGNTRVLYSNATGAVAITIGAGGAGSASGDASTGHDTFIGGVNSAFGSNFADSYDATGFNGGFNSFQGNGGNDTIAGNGSTQVQYNNATSGVTIDLIAGTAIGNGSVGTDTITGGVNSVVGSNFNDVISGTNNATVTDVYFGGGGNDTIDGRGGYDLANYSDSSVSAAIVVNLAAGTVVGDGSVGSDTLQGVELVRGTRFADTFDASGFNGGSTNAGSYDTFNAFEGMAGNDTVTGNGDTRVDYSHALAAVTVDLAAGTGQGTAVGDIAGVGFDTFTGGVNSIRGSDFNDALLGSNNASGAEDFFGGAGNDVIDGRGGFDRAMYSASSSDTTTGGIAVDLAAGAVAGDASIGNDTLKSIEAIRGTNFADTFNATGFSGSSANAGSNGTLNEFEGEAGNDTITGNGNTRIAFYHAASGVNVDLSTGISTSLTNGDIAHVGTDTFTGVAAVRGSDFGDQITGKSGSVTLDGRGGDDILIANGGANTLIGGAGNDQFKFKAGLANGATISDFAGNGAAAGDSIDFEGFGTAAQGATFSFVSAAGGDSIWQIHSGLDSHNELITLKGIATSAGVHSSDYLFAS